MAPLPPLRVRADAAAVACVHLPMSGACSPAKRCCTAWRRRRRRKALLQARPRVSPSGALVQRCGSLVEGVEPCSATRRPPPMSPASQSCSSRRYRSTSVSAHAAVPRAALRVAPGGDVPNHRYSAACLDITCDCIWRGVAIYDQGFRVMFLVPCVRVRRTLSMTIQRPESCSPYMN